MSRINLNSAARLLQYVYRIDKYVIHAITMNLIHNSHDFHHKINKMLRGTYLLVKNWKEKKEVELTDRQKHFIKVQMDFNGGT